MNYTRLYTRRVVPPRRVFSASSAVRRPFTYVAGVPGTTQGVPCRFASDIPLVQVTDDVAECGVRFPSPSSKIVYGIRCRYLMGKLFPPRIPPTANSLSVVPSAKPINSVAGPISFLAC